jgi:hypothetical protein
VMIKPLLLKPFNADCALGPIRGNRFLASNSRRFSATRQEPEEIERRRKQEASDSSA